MRTFLNLAFKFLSRSLVVAAVFFFSTHTTLAQQTEALTVEVLNTAQTSVTFKVSGTNIRIGFGASIAYEDPARNIPLGNIPSNSCNAGVCTFTTNVTLSNLQCNVLYAGNIKILGSTNAVSKGINVTTSECSTGTDPCESGQEGFGPDSTACKVCQLGVLGLCTTCKADPTGSVCTNKGNTCLADPTHLQCKEEEEATQRAAAQAAKSQFETCFPSVAGSTFDAKLCGIAIFDSTVLPLFTAFLRLCSIIFELAVWIGIVKFSVLVGTGPDAWIVAIWSTIRDILNIGVIFVLLYSAINIIVGRGGEIKKLIAGVILFGVLTNFSLFLTRAAVDVSNVVALEFYNQMRTEDDIHNVSFNRGLGATVVEITGLVKFYDAGEGKGVSDEIKTRSKIQDSFMFRFGMIIVFIAVGFMFLQAAFIFIARTVSLVFLLIFSPLMFAGGIFSPIKGAIEKWHKEFLGQVILAPLFFILLYVALTILKNVTDTLDTELGKLYDSGEDYLLPFSIIVLTSGLVIFSFSLAVSKAKEYAGSIGGKAASYGNKMGGFILGKGVGGAASVTARFGQQTLGRFGQAVDNGTGRFAKFGQAIGLANLKDKTFDIRNSSNANKVGQGINKILSTATGAPVTVSAGEGLKGRETRKKEAAEVEQKKADTQIETALKKIDDKTKQYDVFDNTAVDATGATITRAAGDTDDAWEKKVNIANKYEKGKALASKNAYLASHPVATQGSSTLKRANQKAQFKAIKAQQKKLSSETKKEAEHLARKDKLKAYKDELANTFASNASTRLQPPLDGIRLVKNKSEIEAMNDEEVIALWDEIADSVSTEIKLYKADKKSIIDNPNQHSMDDQREVFRAISSFEKLQKKAGNASKDIESLKKAIEAHEQKK